MLQDDIKMMMCHCRNSLNASGELLAAMTRIKDFVEVQNTAYNPSSLTCLCKLEKLSGLGRNILEIDKYCPQHGHDFNG
jgi:hypothetical protein